MTEETNTKSLEVAEEKDFLSGLCPINPDNLQDCSACQ
jgi:hypothetical protein